MVLLLSTHGRLMWSTGQVLHEGRGVYYGAFRDGDTIWVTSRGPRNEKLIQIDAFTGEILRESETLPSTFTHDLCRHDDRVYLTDCNGGRLVVLDFPSLEVLKCPQICTQKNHVNTVAFDPDGRCWCLLHNLGASVLIEVNPETGEWISQMYGVGFQSHGIHWWDNGFVVLSSGEGKVIHTRHGTLWEEPEGKFLKGSCLVGDLFHFGISDVTPRGDRGSPKLNCDLATLNLVTGELVERKTMETKGLLNSILKF
jgi:hypothetical protein